jgi:hypothetical protein
VLGWGCHLWAKALAPTYDVLAWQGQDISFFPKKVVWLCHQYSVVRASSVVAGCASGQVRLTIGQDRLCMTRHCSSHPSKTVRDYILADEHRHESPVWTFPFYVDLRIMIFSCIECTLSEQTVPDKGILYLRMQWTPFGVSASWIYLPSSRTFFRFIIDASCWNWIYLFIPTLYNVQTSGWLLIVGLFNDAVSIAELFWY